MDDKQVTLTESELKAVMTDAIVDALQRVGLDASKPIEVQKDMVHLRRWRLAVDGAQTTTFRAVFGILTAGVLGALWLGIKAMMGQPSP